MYAITKFKQVKCEGKLGQHRKRLLHLRCDWIGEHAAEKKAEYDLTAYARQAKALEEIFPDRPGQQHGPGP